MYAFKFKLNYFIVLKNYKKYIYFLNELKL